MSLSLTLLRGLGALNGRAAGDLSPRRRVSKGAGAGAGAGAIRAAGASGPRLLTSELPSSLRWYQGAPLRRPAPRRLPPRPSAPARHPPASLTAPRLGSSPFYSTLLVFPLLLSLLRHRTRPHVPLRSVCDSPRVTDPGASPLPLFAGPGALSSLVTGLDPSSQATSQVGTPPVTGHVAGSTRQQVRGPSQHRPSRRPPAPGPARATRGTSGP